MGKHFKIFQCQKEETNQIVSENANLISNELNFLLPEIFSF